MYNDYYTEMYGLLIREVKQRKVLYNGLGSRQELTKCWNEVASKTGWSVNASQRRWRYMRDRFKKELSRLPSSFSEKDVDSYTGGWPLFRDVIFILKYMRRTNRLRLKRGLRKIESPEEKREIPVAQKRIAVMRNANDRHNQSKRNSTSTASKTSELSGSVTNSPTIPSESLDIVKDLESLLHKPTGTEEVPQETMRNLKLQESAVKNPPKPIVIMVPPHISPKKEETKPGDERVQVPVKSFGELSTNSERRSMQSLEIIHNTAAQRAVPTVGAPSTSKTKTIQHRPQAKRISNTAQPARSSTSVPSTNSGHRMGPATKVRRFNRSPSSSPSHSPHGNSQRSSYSVDGTEMPQPRTEIKQEPCQFITNDPLPCVSNQKNDNDASASCSQIAVVKCERRSAENLVEISDSDSENGCKARRRNPKQKPTQIAETSSRRSLVNHKSTITSDSEDDLAFFHTLLPFLTRLDALQKLRLRAKIQTLIVEELDANNKS